MDNFSIKSKFDLEVFLIHNLNYSVISKMNFNDYKNFVVKLFNVLNELKKEGLKREDIYDFIQNLYFNEMTKENEANILFERRFSAITEELNAFCADPMFWYSDFDSFMRKREKAFDIDWYKKV